MARSRWIKAVMATVVSTGLAWGQSAVPSAPQAPDDPTGRIITVNEAGRPAQRCRIVKAWADDKAGKCWQVEALDTGEIMTIVAIGAPTLGEAPAAGRPRTLVTCIFHWRDRTPPLGAPLPPTAMAVADVRWPTSPPKETVVVSRETAPPPGATPVAASAAAPANGGSQPAPAPASPAVASGVPASPSTPAPSSPAPAPPTTGSGAPAMIDARTPVIVTIPGPSKAPPPVVSATTPLPIIENLKASGEHKAPAPPTIVTIPSTPAPVETKIAANAPKLPETQAVSTAPPAPASPVPSTPRPAEVKVAQAAPPPPAKPDAPKQPAVATAQTKTPAPAPKVELPHADQTKPDPLLSDPTQYVRKPLDAKLPAKGELPPLETNGMGASAPLPAGARSVTDSGAVRYAPAPVVTLPPMLPPLNARPPAPQWQVPQAPQPIVNPGRGNAPEAMQGGIGYNAFTPPELTPPAPGSPGQSAMANAFSSDTDCCPVPPPMPAGPPIAGPFGPGGGHPPMMAQGGPGRMSPTLPPTPYGPVVKLPAPPASVQAAGQESQVAMLPPPLPPKDSGVTQTGYAAPPAPTAGTVQQLTAQLRDALYPSQRETAAEKLAELDGKENDAAVQALLRALHEDPAATVRACCVRALAKMKANSLPVVSAIQAAKNDSDVRVRAAADEALCVLGTGTAPTALPPSK